MDCFEALASAIAGRRPAKLVTVIAGQAGQVGRHLLLGPDGIITSEGTYPQSLVETALHQEKAGLITVDGLTAYVEPYLPPPRLLVVGAGHVAQPVAHLGKLTGFDVTVMDDRPEYATPARFPDAGQVLCGELVQTLLAQNPGPGDFAVLVTRGHHLDMDCLRAIITRPLAYIGMIGSRNRVETVYRLLQEDHGIDPALFARVHAPIGLDVGARSPGEIAVAIAAELLLARHGGTAQPLSRLERRPVHRR